MRALLVGILGLAILLGVSFYSGLFIQLDQ